MRRIAQRIADLYVGLDLLGSNLGVLAQIAFHYNAGFCFTPKGSSNTNLPAEMMREAASYHKEAGLQLWDDLNWSSLGSGQFKKSQDFENSFIYSTCLIKTPLQNLIETPLIDTRVLCSIVLEQVQPQSFEDKPESFSNLCRIKTESREKFNLSITTVNALDAMRSVLESGESITSYLRWMMTLEQRIVRNSKEITSYWIDDINFNIER